MSAAIDRSLLLDSMPQDAAIATGAAGRERMHRALEAIEDVCAAAIHAYLEALVVFVAADLTASHDTRLPVRAALKQVACQARRADREIPGAGTELAASWDSTLERRSIR